MAEEYAVYKSEDRGRTWAFAGAGLGSKSRINSLSASAGTIFAATDNGIAVSRDLGRSWVRVKETVGSGARITSIQAVDGSVLAGTSGSGVLLSRDDGRSWSVVDSFPATFVRCLLFNQGVVYAGTDDTGVFASKDSGKGWHAMQEGLPVNAQVFALAGLGEQVFAGLYSKGMVTWDSAQARWRHPGKISPLALASEGGNLIAGHNPGGIYWSGDKGRSWTKSSSSDLASFPGAFQDGSTAFDDNAPVWEMSSGHGLSVVGAGSGVFTSVDAGKTWTRAMDGLPKECPGIAFLVRPDFVLAALSIKSSPVGSRAGTGGSK